MLKLILAVYRHNPHLREAFGNTVRWFMGPRVSYLHSAKSEACFGTASIKLDVKIVRFRFVVPDKHRRQPPDWVAQGVTTFEFYRKDHFLLSVGIHSMVQLSVVASVVPRILTGVLCTFIPAVPP